MGYDIHMNGLFTLTKANIKSALVYGVLTLAVSFALAFAQNVLNAGSVFGLNWKAIIDSSVIATIPVLIALISLGKNLLTDSQGRFLGAATVIPDKSGASKKRD